MRFPKKLTDEELMLKEKYELLRKKTKEVLDQEEAAKKKEEQPPKNISFKRSATDSDAKEYAKKLVLSGKITIPSKLNEEKKTFKRPNVEKKISSSASITGSSKDGGGAGGFVSLIPKYTGGSGSTSAATVTAVTSTTRHRSPIRSVDYEVTSGSFTIPRLDASTNVPKRGPSIFVSTQGHAVSEETLRTIFERFGRIVRVRLAKPGVAFVTFATTESAERAISQMHQTIHNGVEYEIEFAWRQPQPFMYSHHDDPSSPSKPTSYQPGIKSWDYKRQQIVYDDDEI